MAISPFDADGSLRQNVAIKRAIAELAQAIGLGTEGAGDTPELIKQSLPELYQIFCEQVGVQNRADGPKKVASRFAESIFAFTHCAKRASVFHIKKPSSEQLAGLFRMFCAKASDLTIDAFYESARIYLCSETSLAQPKITEVSVNDVRVLMKKIGAEGLRRMMRCLDNVVRFMNEVTQSELGNSEASRYVKRLKADVDSIAGRDLGHIASLLNRFLGSEMRTYMESFGYNLNEWFFDNFIGSLGDAISEIESAFKDKDEEAFFASTRAISIKANRGSEMIRHMATLCGVFEHRLLMQNLDGVIPCSEWLIECWKPLLERIGMLCHDLSNMMCPLLGYIEFLSRSRLEDQQRLQDSIDKLKIFDRSTIGSLLSSVIKILGNYKDSVEMELEADDSLSNLEIPKQYRGALFRIVFELCFNAIKYRDEQKDRQFVQIRANLKDRMLEVTVEDNGVGIENLERAMQIEMREHEDLAEGTGMGLASVFGLARRKGWEVNIESQPGQGTKAVVQADTGEWDKGEGAAGPLTSGMTGGVISIPNVSALSAVGANAHGFFSYMPIMQLGYMNLGTSNLAIRTL